MVCGPVQVVWHKFAKYWDIELRGGAHVSRALRHGCRRHAGPVDDNTIVVVPTFGVTYTGAYELVKPLSDALDALHDEQGLDVDIHVDGASGAFLAPVAPRTSSGTSASLG